MEVSDLITHEPARMARKQPGKSISFELLLDEGSKTRARIPLRVIVNAHDTTESIITTVKNFYGIYDGNGVSFEDAQANTLIASYDNLSPSMTVYVRCVSGPPQPTSQHPNGSAPDEIQPHRRTSLGEPFQAALPLHMREVSQSPSRSSSRLARKRSASPPQIRGRRSASQHKQGSCSAMSRGSSATGSFHDGDGYSDSETGRNSVSGSRGARSEHLVNSEISTANVLQDGRRGQTIFDSSTLPLFVPPQVPMPASQSSISPQRRSAPQDGPSPFYPPAQKLYVQQLPMLSPQSFNNSHSYGMTQRYQPLNLNTSTAPHGHHLRDRPSLQPSSSSGGRVGNGILPTPDPTVASCISDEDVARTLIALGDASNYSHGRTSNSTMDETFSGVADAASSTGATSDSEEYSDQEGLPKHRRFLDEGDDEYEHDGLIKSEYEEYEGAPKTKKIRTKLHDGPSMLQRESKSGSISKGSKISKPRSHTMPKPSKTTPQPSLGKVPSAPMAMTQPRKTSSASSLQIPGGGDDEDLSSKPRCQRCRKSKKGCDRERPCQRCKDAGIGADGCISEDEGNGRKGRYGRAMPVKKTTVDGVSDGSLVDRSLMLPPMLIDAVGDYGSPDKNKKRKR